MSTVPRVCKPTLWEQQVDEEWNTPVDLSCVGVADNIPPENVLHLATDLGFMHVCQKQGHQYDKEIQSASNRLKKLKKIELGRTIDKLRRDFEEITNLDFFPGAAQQQASSAIDALTLAVNQILTPGEPHASTIPTMSEYNTLCRVLSATIHASAAIVNPIQFSTSTFSRSLNGDRPQANTHNCTRNRIATTIR